MAHVRPAMDMKKGPPVRQGSATIRLKAKRGQSPNGLAPKKR